MEGKKSFLMYVDWLNTFEELTDEQLGQLMRLTFLYVNDTFETDADLQAYKKVNNVSQVVSVTFRSIQTDLKRDLDKWKETKQKRSEAGKRSAEARASQQTSTKSTSVKSVEQNQQVLNLLNKNEQTSTKSTVNVNDNVNVNVNVNDNVNVKDKNINTICTEQSHDCLVPIFNLPLNTNENYPFYETDLEEYKNLYPAINVEQEFRNMLGWLNANPKNRKTKQGIKRFVNSWLSRSQDKASKVNTILDVSTNVDDNGGFTEL